MENTLILDIFSEKEAELFIKKHLKDETKQDIIKLAKTLHYFPLALGQAVGYIKQHTNIEDYLKLYQIKQQQYLDIKSQDTNQYKETLWKTLFVILAKLSNPAKEILYISSYLESDNIQLELFNELSLEDKSQAIGELRKYSLIILNNPKSFKIHRLLQQTIRLTIQKEKKWLNKIVEMTNKVIKKFDRLYQDTWEPIKNWLHHIGILAKYVPHSLNKANLLDQYGQVAGYFGLQNIAKNLFLQSLRIKKKIKHHNIIIKANTLYDLGLTEYLLGNYKSAKSYNIQCIKIKESFYKDSNHIKLANVLENMGKIEHRYGDFTKAKYFLVKSLTIKENYFNDPLEIELSENLRSLGSIECLIGNYNKGLSLYLRALKIIENYYNNLNHIELAYVINNLGYVKWSFGHFSMAKKFYQRALQIKECHYQNPNHIALAHILNNLGNVELEKRKFLKAKQLYRKVLSIQKSYYQNSSQVELATTLYDLGLAEEGLGNYNDALYCLKTSHEIFSKHFQYRIHSALAHFYSPIIYWYELRENLKNSVKYYQSSILIIKKLFGNNHHFTARYYYLLGQAYEINKQIDKAIEQYKISLKIATEFDKTIKNGIIQEGHRKNIELVKNKLTKVRNNYS